MNNALTHLRKRLPIRKPRHTRQRLAGPAVQESIPEVSLYNLLDELVTTSFPLQPKKVSQNALWLAQLRGRFGRTAL
jgi:hypothetical protein